MNERNEEKNRLIGYDVMSKERRGLYPIPE